MGFIGLGVVAFSAVLVILFIVAYIFIQGIGQISLEFIFGFPQDGMRAGGIWPAILGTIYLTFGTTLAAVPLGIAAAVYLSEYATDNALTRTIRIAIINLSGIPSVVYGLFGLGIFVLFFRLGTSIIAAALTLGIMTLPVIISTAEEALRAVPRSFPRGEYCDGSDAMANYSPDCAAPILTRDSNGCYFGPGTRCWRNRADLVHRCGVLPADFAELTS